MSTRTTLGVWGFQHLALYLCAIIERLYGECHRSIIKEIRCVARKNSPRQLTECHKALDADGILTVDASEASRRDSAKYLTRIALNVIDHWCDTGQSRRRAYNAALSEIARVEQYVACFLTKEDLHRCALFVFEDLQQRPLDEERRDAALAAMSIGHYDVACSIVTDDETILGASAPSVPDEGPGSTRRRE